MRLFSNYCVLKANLRCRLIDKMRVVIILELISIISAIRWEQFKVDYAKRYASISDELHHRRAFERNALLVEQHNANQRRSYSLAINQFGDLSDSEKRSLLRPIRRPTVSTFSAKNVGDPPPTWDWRSLGYVSPVTYEKDFSSSVDAVVGAIETMWAIKNKTLTILSTQQLKDCAPVLYTNPDFLGYLCNIGGLESNATYPPSPTNQSCKFDETKIVAPINGMIQYGSGDEDQLKLGVWQDGAIAIDLNVPGDMVSYSGGIYSNPHCPQGFPNHSMLLVGYGNDNGTDYWLLRNSWGTAWGEQGYIRLARNKNNTCGVADNPWAPTWTPDS